VTSERPITCTRLRWPEILPMHFLTAEPYAEVAIAHLDILLEALYRRLECLPKNNANVSSGDSVDYGVSDHHRTAYVYCSGSNHGQTFR
jgi:hypothetical protein